MKTPSPAAQTSLGLPTGKPVPGGRCASSSDQSTQRSGENGSTNRTDHDLPASGKAGDKVHLGSKDSDHLQGFDRITALRATNRGFEHELSLDFRVANGFFHGWAFPGVSPLRREVIGSPNCTRSENPLETHQRNGDAATTICRRPSRQERCATIHPFGGAR